MPVLKGAAVRASGVVSAPFSRCGNHGGAVGARTAASPAADRPPRRWRKQWCATRHHGSARFCNIARPSRRRAAQRQRRQHLTAGIALLIVTPNGHKGQQNW